MQRIHEDEQFDFLVSREEEEGGNPDLKHASLVPSGFISFSPIRLLSSSDRYNTIYTYRSRDKGGGRGWHLLSLPLYTFEMGLRLVLLNLCFPSTFKRNF
jgi:hypothetical protein